MKEGNVAYPELGEHEEEKPQLTLVPSKITDGRDNLNFAEWPLSSLSERSDPNIKTIYFEDKIFDRSRNEYVPRKVTITGSDAYGLPSPLDEEVLLALIQLSKLQGFRSKRVYFTRHQLLQIMNWSPNGQNYERLIRALDRWVGCTMYFRNAWRDRKTQSWVDESFHLLERVKIVTDERHSESGQNVSYVEWNDVVFRSFQNGNVKSLNYQFLLSVESAIAKRLYRFLDKRFYHTHSLEFELKSLCYEHIGLSRKSPVADLKRKLSKAIGELEEKGYLTALSDGERYRKDAPGLWKVCFHKASNEPNKDSVSKEAPSMEELLKEFGVRESKAAEIVATYSEELIREKLSVAHWLKGKGDESLVANPPGFLIASLEKGFETPKSFHDEVFRNLAKANSVEATKKATIAKQQREKREEEEFLRSQKLVSDYLANLTDYERSALLENAIGNADRSRQRLLLLGGRVAETLKERIIREHVLEILSAS